MAASYIVSERLQRAGHRLVARPVGPDGNRMLDRISGLQQRKFGEATGIKYGSGQNAGDIRKPTDCLQSLDSLDAQRAPT